MRRSWRDADRDFQKELPGGETKNHHLAEVLYNTKTLSKPDVVMDCDEVYPRIYIGDANAAKDTLYLKMLGITHVLNTAEGETFGHVNTGLIYYFDTGIKYLGLPLADLPVVDISKYFNVAVSFIEEAISSNGKILVHCMAGLSRSATCVLAYLMIKKNMLAVDAIRIVCEKRSINPNYGFLYQLAQLDNQLRRQRLEVNKIKLN